MAEKKTEKYTFYKEVKYTVDGVDVKILTQLYQTGIYVAIYYGDNIPHQLNLHPKKVVKAEKAIKKGHPNTEFLYPITVHQVDGFWVEFKED